MAEGGGGGGGGGGDEEFEEKVITARINWAAWMFFQNLRA